ncbi:hypothetical protein GCM10027318_09400 [Massilia agilis]
MGWGGSCPLWFWSCDGLSPPQAVSNSSADRATCGTNREFVLLTAMMGAPVVGVIDETDETNPQAAARTRRMIFLEWTPNPTVRSPQQSFLNIAL